MAQGLAEVLLAGAVEGWSPVLTTPDEVMARLVALRQQGGEVPSFAQAFALYPLEKMYTALSGREVARRASVITGPLLQVLHALPPRMKLLPFGQGDGGCWI